MPRWLIGLSSGMSMSGVDAALVRVDGIGLDAKMSCQPQHALHVPFPADLRTLLFRSGGDNALPIKQLAHLHRVLGESHARAVRKLAEQTRINLAQVMCVSYPGQTLWHEPEGRFPTTFALGMAGALAEGTGVTVLGDFRSRDVVLGGQGLPLTPIVDVRMFHHPKEDRLLVHLGGMATLVWVPASGLLRDVLAFQVAPCSLLLDGLMMRLTNGKEMMDAGGKHAVQGRCIEALLERWLMRADIQRKPPKSIAAHAYQEDFCRDAVHEARALDRNLHDLLCTTTHFVAGSIVHAVQRFLPTQPTRILLSGGGVRNGFLWHLLEQQLRPLPMEKVDVHGIAAEARKAVAFAGLAALTMDGVAVNLPAATGALESRLLGSFTPGAKENWARCLSWMASQTSSSSRLRAA